MFLPIVCILLVATIQFGQMIWADMELTSASRDGARKAAVARSEASPSTAVTAAALGSLDRTPRSEVTVTITGSWVKDSNITVAVRRPYHLNIMGFRAWNGNLHSESVVRIA